MPDKRVVMANIIYITLVKSWLVLGKITRVGGVNTWAKFTSGVGSKKPKLPTIIRPLP